MQFDGDYNFIESLLRRFADIWIGILHQHSNNRRVAKCFVYLLILIFDLLPISGSPDWAAKVKVDGNYVIKSPIYRSVLDRTRQPVRTMLKHIVNELCINAVRIFVVGNEASEAFPCLLKGPHFKDDGVLNNPVSLVCKVKRAG